MLIALVFIAQIASGRADGSDCANARAATYYNTAANWAVGKPIGPGSEVRLCGTINVLLAAQGSGSPTSPTVIVFEPGAKLSRPADGLMSMFQKHDLVLDCQGGIIENTDNGSERQFRKSVIGLNLSGASNILVQNCHFKDLYVHAIATDHSIDLGAAGAIYMPGAGSNVVIRDSTFENVGWAINAVAQLKGSTGLTIIGNTFSNYDHGVAGLGATGGSGNCTIRENHFGTTAVWDTATNTYHHNGIHIYGHAGWKLNGCTIENNTFDGDFGKNNTAHIFMECDDTRANPEACSSIIIRNNRFIQFPGNALSNGFALGGGPGWQWLDNTFLGSGVTNQVAVGLRRSGQVFRGNIVSGVRTFVSSPAGQSFTADGLNLNTYTAQSSGTQPAFVYQGVGKPTFADWQRATGQDSQSTHQ